MPKSLKLPAGVHWEPNSPMQAEALSRSEMEIFVGGSRGGGKTEPGVAWMIEEKCVTNSRYRGLVLRRQVKDLVDWIDKAKVMYKPLEAKFVGNVNQGSVEIQFPWGSIIRTGHLRDREAYQSYQGQEYQRINIEELTQIAQEEWYLMVAASARSTIPGILPQIWCSANPGSTGHSWVRRRFVECARNKTYRDPDTGMTRIFIPFRVYDNPHIMKYNPEYVNWLKGLPEKRRLAWLEGRWDVYEGQFFHRFDPDVHVTKPIGLDGDYLRYRGLDWGDSSPSCVLWIAVGFDGTHYVYRELYQTRRTPQQLAEAVLRMTPDTENVVQTWADPNSIRSVGQYGMGNINKGLSNKTIGDLLAEAGLFCSPASNDRISGWQVIQQLMDWDGDPVNPARKPQLVIFDNCTNLIRTLPDLVHKENNPEDLDTDGEDHAVDALRYACMHTVTASAQVEPEKKDLIEELLRMPSLAESIHGETDYWGALP